MLPQEFIGKSNRVDSNKIKRYKEYIEKNFGLNIEHLNPSLSQRIKYEILKPLTDKCKCGKYLSFSPNSGEIFKRSCGNQSCASYVYDREKSQNNFKKTIQNRDRLTSRSFSNDEVKDYIVKFLKSGVKFDRLGSQKNEICNFIRSESKKLSFKNTQYCYHILNDIPFDAMKDYGFLCFEKGYSKTNRKDGLCGIKKAQNKIKLLLEIFAQNKSFKVIRTEPITKLPWILNCNNCNLEFEQWMHNGVGLNVNIKCPKCYPTNSISSHEYKLLEFIKTNYSGEVIPQYKLNNSQKSLDIYIPEFKLGIEINGLYWHQSETNHLIKMNLCNDQNIQLIQFTDLDYVKKQHIVESMILNKLQLSNRIHARKTIIKQISVKEYKDFTENNHIKGYSAATIKLGCFYNDELVSIFSLSKSRFKSNDIELIRFCSKIGTNIIGGLSKFISYVKNNYDIKSIMTYADLHYGNGQSYVKNGFKFVKQTSPNYYYWYKGRIFSRQTFQKSKLKKYFPLCDLNKTEREILSENGYTRYYDCGNLKLILDLS